MKDSKRELLWMWVRWGSREDSREDSREVGVRAGGVARKGQNRVADSGRELLRE